MIPEPENSVLLQLGRAISKRRLERGLSQEDLAAKAGVHRTYVSDVERGVRNVSILTLKKLCDALELPIATTFM